MFAVVFAWVVCACLGVVGRCGPAVPLLRLACLRVRALVWALLACAAPCLCVGVVMVMGRGVVVPPLCCVVLGCFWLPRGAGGEGGGGGGWGVRSGKCGLGGGCGVVACWVVVRVGGDKCPELGE